MTKYRAQKPFGKAPSRYIPLAMRAGRARGNSAMGEIKQALKSLPTSVAYRVAEQAAGRLTALARSAYDAGRTAYNDPRPRAKDGGRLSLKETGATSREIRFKVVGTEVRCDLGADWRKYLIGKYSILPNGSTPADWNRELDRLTAEAIAEVTS